MKILLFAALALVADPPQESKGALKVFVLAGQSNMQGHGALKTLDRLGQHPTHGHLLAKLKKPDGSYTVRDDVWIHYQRDPKTLKKGKLTAGFGAGDDKIGPEWVFGQVVGDAFEEPVLLVKTAWGGRSLAVNFRPPGAGGETGETYKEMLALVRGALENLDRDFPELAGRKPELAGFAWFQGWNDMIDQKKVDEYESNLAHLIRDLRKDLGAPKLPVVVGELGVGGEASAAKNPRMAAFRKAQAGPSKMPEFEGTVAFVPTTPYWDREAEEFLEKHWVKRKWSSDEAKAEWEKMGSQPPYHYLGSARIYSLVGHGLGEAMLKLCGRTP